MLYMIIIITDNVYNIYIPPGTGHIALRDNHRGGLLRGSHPPPRTHLSFQQQTTRTLQESRALHRLDFCLQVLLLLSGFT